MSARYAACFAHCAERGRAVLVPFWMLGDPTPDASLATISGLVEAGADALELGLPFSDPIADGPVVQAAAQRALASGTTPARARALIAELRRRFPALPLGVLGYLNPFEVHGIALGFAELAVAGADSLLLADLPSVEAAPYARAAGAAGLDLVLVVPPNARPATLDAVAQLGGGYCYLSGRAGVTGTHAAMQAPTATLVAALRARGAPPALVGFGVSTPAHVHAAHAAGARGAIVGSALIDAAQQGAEALRVRFAALRAAA